MHNSRLSLFILELEDDLEVIWKKETGFGKIHFKLGENENDVKGENQYYKQFPGFEWGEGRG